jgi:DNA-binding transcriptional MocR family regulator
MAATQAPARAQPRYLQVANSIEAQIESGALRVGDRIPSIRALRRRERVSVSTVLEAYHWLERRGRIEPRPRSGFFVRVAPAERIPEPHPARTAPAPATLGAGDILAETVKGASDPGVVPLGAGCPGAELLPNARLNALVRAILREEPDHSASYAFPPGSEELRRQIARRAPSFGCVFSPADVVVTCGAMEALNLGLRAVARPGDVVAVESPTYFGILQAIEALGMKAAEIPAHPREGIDLDLLDHAIRRHRVRAAIVVPNGHNPLGYVLSDDRKKALVELLARHRVPLIEDDLYGDLAYEEPRPRTAKAFDRAGLVMLCSSFSKVLAPGYRVGWIHAGRFRDRVVRLQFLATVATPSLPQKAVARFLETGGYDRYVRGLTRALREQVERVSQAIARYFPEGTRLTRPAAGYLLWVELPKEVDAVRLFRRGLAERIGILPGTVFSPTGRFRNHIRISCGHPWSEAIDRALLTLGRLCARAR